MVSKNIALEAVVVTALAGLSILIGSEAIAKPDFAEVYPCKVKQEKKIVKDSKVFEVGKERKFNDPKEHHVNGWVISCKTQEDSELDVMLDKDFNYAYINENNDGKGWRYSCSAHSRHSNTDVLGFSFDNKDYVVYRDITVYNPNFFALMINTTKKTAKLVRLNDYFYEYQTGSECIMHTLSNGKTLFHSDCGSCDAYERDNIQSFYRYLPKKIKDREIKKGLKEFDKSLKRYLVPNPNKKNIQEKIKSNAP